MNLKNGNPAGMKSEKLAELKNQWSGLGRE